MTHPEYDEFWIGWFDNLVDIPLVVFITPYELWAEMPPQQTVQVWTSSAPESLRRIEFWSSAPHIEFTDDILVGMVSKRMEIIGNVRIKFAMVKHDDGIWQLLDKGEPMVSGPHMVLKTCRCIH
jgi:hypothetical protein